MNEFMEPICTKPHRDEDDDRDDDEQQQGGSG